MKFLLLLVARKFYRCRATKSDKILIVPVNTPLKRNGVSQQLEKCKKLQKEGGQSYKI
jgi:hypothetical protein